MKRTVGLGLGTLGFAVLWQQARRLGRFKWPARAAAVAAYAGVGLALALGAFAATADVYYLDNTNGACSDGYTEGQARNDPSKPFCTMDALDSVAASGGYVRCRGSYGDWTINADKTIPTTITPIRGGICKTTGITFSSADNWTLAQGIEVTGTSDATSPATTTSGVLVDASAHIDILRANIHDTAHGVLAANSPTDVDITGTTFKSIDCSIQYDSCPTSSAGSAIAGTFDATSDITDNFAEDVEDDPFQQTGATSARNASIKSDQIPGATWTAGDLGANTLSQAYNASTDAGVSVVRVPADDYAGVTSLSGSATLFSSAQDKPSGFVIFKGLGAGARMPDSGSTLGSLKLVDVADFAFDNWTVTYWKVRSSGATEGGATMRDVVTTSGIWDISGSVEYLNIIGGQTGPCTVIDVHGCAPGIESAASGNEPADILIEDHLFGPQFYDSDAVETWRAACEANPTDPDYPDCEEGHGECLHVFTGDGLTIRRSTFDHCIVYGINFAGSTQQPSHHSANDVLVENNVFTAMDAHFQAGLFMGGGGTNDFTNYDVRNNTLDRSVLLTGGTAGACAGSTAACYLNVLFENNAIANFSPSLCGKTGVTSTNNIFADVTDVGDTSCATDAGATIGVDERGRPRRGSPLINAGSGTGPSTDRTGYARPGSGFDVGAYEYPVR